jgi:hypothetical protein
VLPALALLMVGCATHVPQVLAHRIVNLLDGAIVTENIRHVA